MSSEKEAKMSEQLHELLIKTDNLEIFAAVEAFHVSWEKSMLSLLREKSWTISRIEL